MQRNVRRLQSLQIRNRTLEAHNDRLETDLLAIRSDNDRLRAQQGTVTYLLEENVRLQQDLSDSQSLCSQLRQKLTETDDDKLRLQGELDELKQQLVFSRAQSAYADQQATSLAARFENVYAALRRVQVELSPQSEPLDPSAESFSEHLRRFIRGVSSRLIAPWAGVNPEIARRDVQIDELTSANISYARDLRELRAQLIALSPQRR